MATTTLPTAPLGATGMEITRVGFGAWAIGGGDWQFGWGDQDDSQSVDTIGHALELGINWIDTARAYGFGHSERVVGRALEGVPAAQRPYVFTKGGIVDRGGGAAQQWLKADSLRAELEQSLANLGVDAIDLYQIHWPVPDEDLEEAWSTFAAFKQEGLVRHIGLSNCSVAQLRRAQAIAPVETLQPPYSLVDPGAAQELLPYCLQEGIGTIVYSPMGSGLLTSAMSRERIASMPANDWRKSSADFQEPAVSRHLATAERLAAVGDRHGVKAGAVAVAWTLANPAVSGAIVGFRHPDQVDPLVPAASLELSPAEIAEIEG